MELKDKIMLHGLKEVSRVSLQKFNIKHILI